MNRCLLKVGQVHRNLRLAPHQETSAFHEPQAACRKTHRLGDLLGDVDVAGVEKDVVSDQEFSGSDHRGAGGRVHARLAKVRLACRVGRDLITDAFELSAPDVFEVLAVGRGGRGFVKVHGNSKAARDLRTNVASHRNTILQRHAVDWNERNYVGSAHAGVRTLVLSQVDELRGFADTANRGFLDRVAIANQSDDAAIVVRVHFAVEQVDAGNLHGLNDGVDLGCVAALGKIRNALH